MEAGTSTTSHGFTCNVCSMVFGGSELQRKHMREPWHIYNIKRRMASLPSISFQMYREHVELSSRETEIPLERRKNNDTITEEQVRLDTYEILFNQCLFCNKNSSTLEQNLQHMSLQHGLFIPDQEYVTDMETFIGYLGSIIRQDHECHYCGTTKATTEGIQQHMMDKGHCLMNFDGEPEILEFWEFPDSDADQDDDHTAPGRSQDRGNGKYVQKAMSSSTSERQLPSGLTIGSRSGGPRRPNVTKRAAVRLAKMKAIADSGLEGPPTGQTTDVRASMERRVAVRGELGMIGVPEQHKHALMVVEKKIQKREAVARAAERWATEKVANKQKYYRAAGPMRPLG